MRTKFRTYQVLGFALVAVIGSLVMGSSSCDCDPASDGGAGDVCDNDGDCVSLGLGDCRHLFCETYARGGGVCTAGDRPDGTACNRTQDAMHECQAGACVPSAGGTGGGGMGGMGGIGGSGGNSCPEIDVPEPSDLTLKSEPRPAPGTGPQVSDDPNDWDQTNYLVNGDFEAQDVFSGGPPTDSGYWAFDQAWSAPSGQQGIPARGGNGRMLHFVSSSPNEQLRDVGSASEQIQLVDVSALTDTLIRDSRVQVEASAYFNRVAPDGELCRIDNSFGVFLAAYDGPMTSFPARISSTGDDPLGSVQATILADDNPAGWELATTTLTLPEGTTYFEVRLFVNENGFNDAGYPEFHGHYADDVRLTVRLLP